MKKILSLFLILFAVSVAVDAERTTRHRLDVKPQNTTVKIVVDTIIPDSGKIVIAGFDKPLRSSRETFFVTNHYDRTVSSLTVTFAYYDMNNRQLHSSTNTITCYIPAGETRQLSVKSWDTQQSFYYCQSVKPKRNPATPFSVKHNILWLTLLP